MAASTSTARMRSNVTHVQKTVTSRWPEGIKEGVALNFKTMD